MKVQLCLRPFLVLWKEKTPNQYFSNTGDLFCDLLLFLKRLQWFTPNTHQPLFLNHPYNHKTSDPVVSFIEKRLKKICLVKQWIGKIIPLSFQLFIFVSLYYLRFPWTLSSDAFREFRMASYSIIAWILNCCKNNTVANNPNRICTLQRKAGARIHSPVLGTLMAIHCLAYLTLMRQEMFRHISRTNYLDSQAEIIILKEQEK